MKNNWLEVKISNEYIQCKTQKSIKINLPVEGKFSGYSLWLSKKLITEYMWDYFLLAYKKDFKFNIKKCERKADGTYETVDTKTISSEELEDEFAYLKGKSDIPIIHEPPILKNEKVKILEELLDD